MVILGNALSAMHVDEQIESSSSLGAIRVDELDHYNEEWIPPFTLRGVRIKTNEKFSDHYELYEEMGAGKFGKVYRCMEKSTKLTLAAKSIRLKKDSDLKKVEKEVNIMTKMRHKCIAQIYDAFITPNSDVILIMEICEGGELFDRVEEDEYILTEMAVAMIIYQILEAIKYIHSQNIIHLDLKPENIMCVSRTSNEIKMIDFGLAQYFDGQSDLLFMAGTPEFAAPEVIKFEPLSFHTDMWSLGVMTYLLLTGVSPFAGETVAHTYCNVEKGKWSFCEEFADNGISEEAKDFISQLLVYEKEKRMLPEDCLRHSWIVQCKARASRSATPINLPNIEKPLNVSKLRRYIRNKRFRRLVFGVMFINSVVRMMQTLQVNKSTHGIEYVRNMLNVANEAKVEATSGNKANGGTSGDAASGLLKAFTKRRPSKALADERMDFSEGEASSAAGKPKASNKAKEQLEVPGMVTNAVGDEGDEKRNRSEAKKKRTKSTARKTDQQRTRSSTEQTSKKKQRTDVAHTGADQPVAVEVIAEPNREKTTPTPTKQGSPKRTVKFEETTVPSTSTQHKHNDQQHGGNFQLPVVVCMLPKKDESVKQKEGDTVKVKVTKVFEPKLTTPIDEAKKLLREGDAKLKSNHATQAIPSTSKVATSEEKGGKVGSLLKRLEDRQSEKAAPLAFAVSAVQPRQQIAKVTKLPPEPEVTSTTVGTTKLRRKKSTKCKEREESVERVAPTRVVVGELERSVRSEEIERIEKRRLRKETTAETKVGDRLAERESKKSAQHDLVVHELKKTTAVERAPKKTTDEDKVISNEYSAKSAFRARIEEMERMSNLTGGKDAAEIQQKKSMEKSTKLAVENKKMENGIVTRGKIQLEERDKHSTGADTVKGTLEFERAKLRKVHAKENGNCEEQVAVECVHKVTVKKLKKRSTGEKKTTKTKAQSVGHDDFAAQVKSANASADENNRRTKTVKTLHMRLGQQAHAREKRESAMSVEVAEYGGWDAVGQDVFDFSLLRKKLQNRIMGMKDEEDLATEEENRHKCELRVQLGCNLNIKRAMKKWISMDKEQQHH